MRETAALARTARLTENASHGRKLPLHPPAGELPSSGRRSASTCSTGCTPRPGRPASSLHSSTTSRSRSASSTRASARPASHGLLGYTGDTNVQGEQVQKLDEFSNEVLINVLERSGHCGVIASEEVEQLKFTEAKGKYAVLFDPLDGSSNIDTNVGIGTIFALLRRKTPRDSPSAEDALRPGHEIACAGYALYGPSTDPHPLDRARGSTRSRSIRTSASSSSRTRASACPMRGSCYSVNEGNFARWIAAGAEVEPVDQERGQADRAPVRASVRRVARRRRAPDAREGGHLRVPAGHEVAEGEAPAALRGEPDGVPVRASGGGGERRSEPRSST